MQVKLISQKKTCFLVFKNDVLLACELILRQELEFHAGQTAVVSFKKQGFHLLVFFMLFIFFVLSWRPLGFFWRFFGASVVSFACWCHPCRCLWLAWAVCGLSLLLFVVPVARLDF